MRPTLADLGFDEGEATIEGGLISHSGEVLDPANSQAGFGVKWLDANWPLNGPSGLGVYGGVIAFAFAQEQDVAVKEFGAEDGSIDLGFAEVVEVHATALDILSGLAFAGRQAGEDQEFGEGHSGTVETIGGDGMGGDFADHFAKEGFGDAMQGATKEDVAGADGIVGGGWAMDQEGQFPGQPFLGEPGFGVGGGFGGQGFDFLHRKEGEHFEQTEDVVVLGLDKELVEAVGAGALGIEPDGAGGTFSVLGAVAFGEEGEGQAPHGGAEFASAEFDAGGDVAPLIGGAHLKFALELASEVHEVEGLEQHVAELGVGDAGVAVLHAGADRILGDHPVDGEMLAHLTEELEVGHGGDPIGIIDQPGAAGGRVEIEEAGELFLDGGDVMEDLVAGLQVAFGGTAGGIADHAGGAAGQGDGSVPGQLEASQGQEGHQVTDVEGIGGGIKAAIQGQGTLGQAGGQGSAIGAIGVKTATFKIGQEVHRSGRG